MGPGRLTAVTLLQEQFHAKSSTAKEKRVKESEKGTVILILYWRTRRVRWLKGFCNRSQEICLQAECLWSLWSTAQAIFVHDTKLVKLYRVFLLKSDRKPHLASTSQPEAFITSHECVQNQCFSHNIWTAHHHSHNTIIAPALPPDQKQPHGKDFCRKVRPPPTDNHQW